MPPRRRALAVAVLFLAPVLVGCSAIGADDQAARRAAESGPSVSPLSGKVVRGALPDRPVLVVKIDNTATAAPQVGLSDADLVTEELVEGGLTRLAVFYWSQLPDQVGPVRSMRATDLGILQPAGARLVASGGAPPTVKRIAAGEIITYTDDEGDPGFSRDPGRDQPYDLMVSLPELADGLQGEPPPQPYLPFEPAVDARQGDQATVVDAVFSASSTTSWRLGDAGYRRTGGYAADGDDFVADNLLVLRVEVKNAGYKDPAGNPVPETDLQGSGAAMLFSAGTLTRGTWSKDGLAGAITLQLPDGAALEVPAGQTWIELVPEGDGGDVRWR